MRALLLAPHNDDETLFAGFLIMRYRPHVVVCFRSQVQGKLYDISAADRETETELALGFLECTGWTQWPILDEGVDPEVVEGFMWGLRDPAGYDDWDKVFAPAVEKGGTDQHNLIGELAQTVFHDVDLVHYTTYTAGAVRSRKGTQVQIEPEWIVRKHAALACYESQMATPSHRHFLEDLTEYVQ